ncbi:MAG: MFS transporter, partial [Atopobiaceae bacterium]|nr:MFS transporter [Atopobiaceae bacterium]
GWRAGEIMVAVLTVVLCLPAILFVPSCDPSDAGLAPLGAEDAPAQAAVKGPKPPIKVDRMLFGGVVLYAVLSAAVSAMPQHFPGFAEEVGLSAAVGAGMISACMVANTFGKIVMGWLTDHIGARASIMAYTALVVAAIAALLLVHVPAAFLVAAFFFGMCYARATVGLSMMCREVFGKRGFGIVYPVAALGCSFSNAIFSSAVGFGYDLTGGYTISLVVFLAFLVASAALTQWCYRGVK